MLESDFRKIHFCWHLDKNLEISWVFHSAIFFKVLSFFIIYFYLGVYTLESCQSVFTGVSFLFTFFFWISVCVNVCQFGFYFGFLEKNLVLLML